MRCFDREEERQELWAHFQAERNVSMLAPRRIGKTVILNQLIQESESRGYCGILVNLEGYRVEKDFYRALCAELQEQAGYGTSLMASFVTRLKSALRSGDDASDWRQLLLHADVRDVAENLLSAMIKAKPDRKWLVLVDEIPMLVSELLRDGNRDRAHQFLYSLRNLQQSYPEVRWLFTGSIGLDSVARRAGLEGSVVDMEVFSLPPFSRTIAAAFIEMLANRRSKTLTVEASDQLLEGMGWLCPYYLEKTAELALRLTSQRREVCTADVQQALDDMLSLAHRTYWATWREHLDKNFPDPERTYLFTILRLVAESPEGAGFDILLGALNIGGRHLDAGELGSLLDTLCADGYLDSLDGGNRFRFRMGLLRRWWLRYQVRPPK